MFRGFEKKKMKTKEDKYESKRCIDKNRKYKERKWWIKIKVQ
jgi:hypothetical protein